jgi:cobalt-zinc-cadmium resistance protein CzcA
MIAALVEASVRSRLVVVLVTILGALLGIRAYRELPIDAAPDLTNVQVQILSNAPGLSPLETENLVTRPVELAMAGIPGTTVVRSLSRAGVSAVTIVFRDDVELDRARQLVAQRLPEAREAVPRFASAPEMGPPSTGLGEIFHFVVRWPGHSLREVRSVLDWEIALPLKLVPGVVEVNAWGGERREIDVRLRTQDLQAYELSVGDVERAVGGAGVALGGGALVSGDEQLQVRLDGTYRTLDDVADQVVKVRDRAPPVLVRDVATVREGSPMRQSAATANGQGEVVYAMAQMVAGGNAHAIVRDVKARLDELKPRLPEGMVLETIYDRTSLVDRVLGTVRSSLLEGGVVVALVLLLFLGDLRAGIVVASAIPLAMLAAFGCMRVAGVSGNLMSLGAIDFGLVVDGAVVVVEGALATMAARRVSAAEALVHEARAKGRPLALAMLILSVVYVPVLMLEGVEGKLFRPMALTVLFALGAALVLSFTWIPAIASMLLRGAHDEEPRVVRALRATHERLLAPLVARPWLAFTLALTLVGLGLLALVGRGAEFVPRLDEGDFVVQVTRPASLSLAEAVEGAGDVERALRAFPEVRSAVSRMGSPDVATDVMGLEQSDVFVLLAPRSTWSSAKTPDELAARMSEALTKALPGATFGITQPIEMRTSELLGGVKSDVGVVIFGDDLEALRNLEGEVIRGLRGLRGAADVRGEALEGMGILSVRPDPLRAGRAGISPSAIAATVELLRAGRPVATLREGERRYDVVLRDDAPPAPTVEAFRQSSVLTERGKPVPLGDVASIITSDAPAVVGREHARRRVLVECNVRDRDLAGFVGDARAMLGRIDKPKSFSFEIRGQYDHLVSSLERLAIVVPVVLLALVALLFLTFNALRPTLLVLANVPIAASGGVIALAARGLPLSISAAIGLIALFGVATLNGVVLLSGVLDRIKSGETTDQAVVQGARDRFRPVLTTAFVAALGFVPMASASGSGAEVQRPLATVVIGGLVTATVLTLLLLPALARAVLVKPQGAAPEPRRE